MNELMQSIAELEEYRKYLQEKYGDRLYSALGEDGKPLIEPVLTALTNGYAALYRNGVI